MADNLGERGFGGDLEGDGILELILESGKVKEGWEDGNSHGVGGRGLLV